MKRATLGLFFFCFFVLSPIASRADFTDPGALPPKRILLVGNSFTYLNNGIDSALKTLAPTAVIDRLTPSGYTLKRHWEDQHSLSKIKEGRWDLVVLQDQSQNPVFNFQAFSEYGIKLDREIKRAGAKTVLLMTWQRPDSVSTGVTTENLARAYRALGAKIGAQVAPVGLAFEQIEKERPELSLYVNDGHPTPAGTYLAACVLFTTIYGNAPISAPPENSVLSVDLQKFLRKVARETTE